MHFKAFCGRNITISSSFLPVIWTKTLEEKRVGVASGAKLNAIIILFKALNCDYFETQLCFIVRS